MFGLWTRGTTFLTEITRFWSKSEFERNQLVEKRMVFENMSSGDAGRGRRLVCTLNEAHINYEANARLIVAAPELLFLAEDLIEQVDQFKDKVAINTESIEKLLKIIKNGG